MKLQKVYFFWICPNVEAFEWFGNLLKSMEHQLRDVRKEAFLDYNIYLTRGWDTKMASKIICLVFNDISGNLCHI